MVNFYELTTRWLARRFPATPRKEIRMEQVLRSQASGGTARAGDRSRRAAGVERHRLGRPAGRRRDVRRPGSRASQGRQDRAGHPVGEDGRRPGHRAGGPPAGPRQGAAPPGGRRQPAAAGEDPALRRRPPRAGHRARRQLVRPRGRRPAVGGRDRLHRRGRPAPPLQEPPAAGGRRAAPSTRRTARPRASSRTGFSRFDPERKVEFHDAAAAASNDLWTALVLRRPGARRVPGAGGSPGDACRSGSTACSTSTSTRWTRWPAAW